MAATKIASSVWEQMAALNAARQFSMIESLLKLKIHSEVAHHDVEAAATARIAYGLHLQKVGRLSEATRQLLVARRSTRRSLNTYDCDFYLAKIASQYQRNDEAEHAYEELERTLRSGRLELSDREVAGRIATLFWRRGFATLMTGDVRAATTAFALHREVSRSGTNQFAINRVYGATLPQLLVSDRGRVTDLDEALEATSGYQSVDLTARFTHPQLALVQRDLLNAVGGLQRVHLPTIYQHLWTAGFALHSCGANERAEGIAEFLAILTRHVPEATTIIKVAAQGSDGFERLILRASHADEITEGFEAAIERYLDSVAHVRDRSADGNESLGVTKPQRLQAVRHPRFFAVS